MENETNTVLPSRGFHPNNIPPTERIIRKGHLVEVTLELESGKLQKPWREGPPSGDPEADRFSTIAATTPSAGAEDTGFDG